MNPNSVEAEKRTEMQEHIRPVLSSAYSIMKEEKEITKEVQASDTSNVISQCNAVKNFKEEPPEVFDNHIIFIKEEACESQEEFASKFNDEQLMVQDKEDSEMQLFRQNILCEPDQDFIRERSEIERNSDLRKQKDTEFSSNSEAKNTVNDVRTKKPFPPQARNQREVFKCPECDFKTSRKFGIRSHSVLHSKKKLFRCSECDYECNHKNSLKVHMLNHSDIKLYKCSLCDYEGNRKDSLVRHLVRHSKSKSLKCTECDFETTKSKLLRFHLLRHFTEAKSIANPDSTFDATYQSYLEAPVLNRNSQMVKCLKCGFRTGSKSNLQIHMASHRKNEIHIRKESVNTNEMNFSVKLENESQSSHSVDFDVNTSVNGCVEGIETVNGCEERSLHMEALSLVKVKKENGLFKDFSECDYPLQEMEDVFACSFCSSKFKSKALLKSHLVTHTGVRLFKCSMCSFEFKRKGDLKNHMLIHSSTKLYKCTECAYECIRKCDLKKHYLTHSDIKLFQCPECDYDCNYKNSFKIHLLSHSEGKYIRMQ